MCSSFSEYGDCSTDEFKCTNGKCINATLACDRKDGKENEKFLNLDSGKN